MRTTNMRDENVGSVLSYIFSTHCAFDECYNFTSVQRLGTLKDIKPIVNN
jgi:hypothetical protein